MLSRQSPTSTIAALAGGKARGLHELQAGGFVVPRWAAVGTDAFAASAAGLEPIVAELETADLAAALDLATQLRCALRTLDLPDSVRAVVADAYSAAGAGTVAVRSSGLAEDGEIHSHAGQFDSVLNVGTLDAVEDAVRECWASAFSERAVRYRALHGIPSPTTGIGVVIQELVPATISGVVFTANPITGNRDELAVSAVYGIGEGLVSGAVDADYVLVDKASRALLETVVGEKADEVVPKAGGGTETVATPGRSTDLALTERQIAELTTLGVAVEAHFGRPQDIEWVSDGDQIWVVQARPITTLAPLGSLLAGAAEHVGGTAERIWDNSNIIESFSGMSLPLTATTAADVYGRVYRKYAESLRVPAGQLRQLDEWTPAMLGYFHGRVYYNLLHWYRMVRIAPGYPLNRRVLEVALGVDENLPTERAKALRPFTFRSPVHKAASRLVTTVTYAKRFAEIDTMMTQFLDDFYRTFDAFEAVDYDTLPGDEVYRRYRDVERELVDRWGPMMVLDAILLTSSGLLFALTKLLLPDAPEWFTYAVASPGAEVESAEPAAAMRDLAALVAADPRLREFVNTTPPTKAYAGLGEWPEFAAAVDEYIARYGYRSLDELKLETPDLREDPSSIFVMLRSAVPEAPPTRRGDADAYLDAHLHGFRRRAYEALRSKTSRCLAHRERLRFCRTRAFGLVKRTIRAMGRDLERRDVLDDFADVFYLRLEELHACFESEPDGPALRELIAARKAIRAADARLVAPARFTTRGEAFDRASLAAQGWVPVQSTAEAAAGTILQGTPSAPGLVTGTAVVVTEPADVAGGILVTYRTDPGWVAALPSAAALVIERGSPLTHVAIVARELGVPTVVQIPGASTAIRTGMRLAVDGEAGTVTILADA